MRSRSRPVAFWQRALSFGGIFVLLFLAWTLSLDRKRFPWRIALWGVGLQLLFAVLVLKTTPGMKLFSWLNTGVVRLLEFTDAGSRFVFGSAVDEGFSIALNVLPTVLFFSSLMAVAYHLGLVQRIVYGIAWLMRRTMKTTGPETLSAAANIFVGQTEAPLVIKPYVASMSLSELNAVMVGGFATVAGGVLAGYVDMLRGDLPDIAGHLIAASVLSAPAALVVAKIMVPETKARSEDEVPTFKAEAIDANVIDAAARGAGEGLKLALNVGAMLLAFVALVAMVNALIGVPVELVNGLAGTSFEPWTLESILGTVFTPIAFVMGVATEDCGTVGALLGEKLVVTEFVAYGHLAEMLREGADLQYRSVVIATYALCGFANFGSIAIQIGGIGAIAPERRSDLARLGLRAMLGGAIAACMTATVAGILL
ncbi:MAG: nucleoside transporter C-terminal domain-containing protein [Myxococcota bacterium]